MILDDVKKLDLPDAPGVYLFRNEKNDILYIGKATSLRDRVRSYFSSDLAATRSSAIARMVEEAHVLTWEETGSVLEALILEANLIKNHQPPFNTLEKDNKSFNYLVITREDFPRVLTVRGRQLFQDWKDEQILHLFGPFTEGASLKEAVKIVRKIFPFRDTCVPREASAKRGVPRKDAAHPRGKPCFNRQIGLCPGVCSGEISKEEYAQTIKHIAQLFSGKISVLKRDLKKEMDELAKAEKFEEAATLRKQIHALEHIRDVSLIKRENVSAGGGVRIEAYDVAHTAGRETVGAMVVVHSGEAVKNAYRKFKIQTAGNNDVASLKEMLTRRLTHTEWELPRVIVVDGSTAQLRTAQKALTEAGVQIPIVGVVKNEKHQPDHLIGDSKMIAAHERDILLANSEAHRFAIQYHRKRRGKLE